MQKRFQMVIFICFLILSLTPCAYALEIDNINSATGGDITKNELIMEYVSKTAITDQVISAAKYGTPMVIFGDGSHPRAMIVAGVHGNEIPTQIAAMKLINYLNGRSIKGTVYILPFLIPSSTETTSRYWNGKNPNSIANVPGTPTNIVLNVAEQKNVNFLGDFHSTRPGGDPGKNSVLCTEIPCSLSYEMAAYIKNQTGSSLISSQKAGVDYPGALEDVSNLAGIPAVTCEVLSSHGTVRSGSVTDSYEQMEAFLKFCKIL